jgi:hypothetical protein
VRDEFSGAVKTVLAQRAAGRCSNPGCGAVTSGPGLDPDTAVNVGVAAHITAASPGGPRYDPSLAPADRSAAPNGIWLCQRCAKLIDTDLRHYTAQMLMQWKARAEGRAAAMLAVGAGSADQSVDLVIPAAESPDSLLSFASVVLARVGRDAELSELNAFSARNGDSPGGCGPARRAQERAASPLSYAGRCPGHGMPDSSASRTSPGWATCTHYGRRS